MKELFIIKKYYYLIILPLLGCGLFLINKVKDEKTINETTSISEYNSYIDSEADFNQSELTEEIEEVKPIFSYTSIPENIKEKMIGLSMPENEPISFDTLSYLTLSYYDFDGNIKTGEMIVDKRVASQVVDIFKEVFDKKYPIDKIKLIDEYNAIDNLSMANNNSSSFCYRTIANTTNLSNHGKGLAIDINPLQNPHVVGDNVSPKEGYVFADRLNIQMGMIVEGDDLYNAFTERGWSWGGHWNNPDYQHFEKNLD
ncbi:MAG: M15 family metallopeptidase [Romboutsia sp.]|uniref:M15 family metallopeptidase n=1 Tax=Romboutsia sp. TaxID=1965302 RepID=UPI003F3F9A9B